MIFLGKIRFKWPIKTKKIAEKLDLEDIVFHKTDDITGIMKWKGGNILVLFHLTWGDINDTEKMGIFVHHLEDTDVSEFFRFIMERLRDIAVEASIADQEITNMTKKEISEMAKKIS